MRVIIEIPPAFVRHYEKDRFEESLRRLSADAHLLAGNYEKELVEMLIDAFRQARKETNDEVQ